ncbi:MAG TPA: asparagine synthase (glutamine-hydrolyzing), partial [Pyrinomonadaceae bacterium]|nr:asparagine synthase (glutamine-hydrolyzing) [Pyrinomonadaceae bacterium]
GIAGIVGSPQGRDAAARAARMNRALAHRGPDADGLVVWDDPEARRETVFAHRRLSIIDLSDAGRQPMTSRDGRFTVVLNGEIYNYRELRRELEAEGVRFATATDTEVMLELYAKRGPQRALEHLRGMFAFAVRDHSTGEVFAARDRLGIKPFYYFAGACGFLFASEVRALLASGLVPRTLDPVSLNAYMSFGAMQEPRTIVEGVRSLPPAHYLVVGHDGRVKETVCYWRLPREKFKGTPDEAVAETRRRLEESIGFHLVADVPLGAFLSGGLDSTAIVALLARQRTRAATFTVVFDEHEFSERESARRVASALGTTHTEIVLAERDLLARLPHAVASIDQPTIDGINTWVVADATRGAGITVALSGVGGDELFGGYPSFRRAAIVSRLGAPFRLMGAATRQRLAGAAAALMGDSLRSQKIAAAISAGGDLLASYTSSRGLFARDARAALLGLGNGKALSAGPDYYLPPETLSLVAHGGNGDAADTFNHVSRYEMSLYMANMLLRDTDVMSMAHALEVRVPLLDHKLVEWVYALPGRLKSGGRPKQLLVEAVGSDFPRSVLNQRKMGFTLPFERWLHTALKPFVTDALKDERALESAGLDAGAVSQIWHNFERGSRSTSWSRVWGLAVLVEWCRRHKVTSDE